MNVPKWILDGTSSSDSDGSMEQASKMREEQRRLQRRWLSMRSEGGKSEGEEGRAWSNNSWIWKVPHMQQASFRAH